MGWSVTLTDPPEPSSIDAVLLILGKAMYLACAYEHKCQYVLRMANLASYAESHPTAPFSEVLASAAHGQRLAPTINGLQMTICETPEVCATLERARKARNTIAHEGDQFGHIISVTEASTQQYVDMLRPVVADLAAGDSIVSRWVHEIDEREPAPADIAARYPAMVDRWVFGHLEWPVWRQSLSNGTADREPAGQEATDRP